jgi:hypothetical protein
MLPLGEISVRKE